MKRAVIIGGGIAGLATAYSIREHQEARGEDPADLEVVILEKKDRVGGNIRTDRVDGFLIEGGPDCFLSEKPWALELCKRIGLSERLMPTNDEQRKTFVLSGGALHELPEGVILMVPTRILPLAASSLLSAKGKLRMAMEYFVPKKEDPGDESLGEFVRRRLGKETLDKIAEPLVAGVHAGDPETMSVNASFPKFVQMEQEYGSLMKGMLKRMSKARKAAKAKAASGGEGKRPTMFMTLEGGLSEMIETLVGRIEGFGNTTIRTGVGVRKVEKKGKGYVVDLDGETIEADTVTVAAPAWAASEVVKAMDRELSEKLLTIPYVSTATVSVAYKKDQVPHPLNGFGFVVPKIENRRIMASTWTSVKFNHRAPEDSVLMRCFVGGAKNTDLVSLNDDEMVRLVTEELRDILGIEAEPLVARVYRYINAMPQYTIGHIERVEWIDDQVATHPGLYLTGSAYHGIGIADSVRNGELVAKKILHYLS